MGRSCKENSVQFGSAELGHEIGIRPNELREKWMSRNGSNIEAIEGIVNMGQDGERQRACGTYEIIN